MGRQSDTEQRLEKELKGWEVCKVLPPKDAEGYFTLVVERGQKRKHIEVCGTDLGWWFHKKTLKGGRR